MRYEVRFDGYPLLGSMAEGMNLPAIPGTAQEIILDTREGLGQTILEGYCKMKGIRSIKANEEINLLRTAINEFCIFMAGLGQDNCNQVTTIKALENDITPLIPEEAAAFVLQSVIDHTADTPLKYKPKPKKQ